MIWGSLDWAFVSNERLSRASFQLLTNLATLIQVCVRRNGPALRSTISFFTVDCPRVVVSRYVLMKKLGRRELGR